MVLAGAIMLFILVLVAVFKLNRLHPLQFVFIWLVAAILSMDVISIVGSNLQHYEQPKQLQMFYSSLLFQILLVPALMIGFLGRYRIHSRPAAKWLVLLTADILLTAADYGAAWSGVWKHERWYLWNDLLLWGVFVLCCLAAERMFYWYLPQGADRP